MPATTVLGEVLEAVRHHIDQNRETGDYKATMLKTA